MKKGKKLVLIVVLILAYQLLLFGYKVVSSTISSFRENPDTVILADKSAVDSFLKAQAMETIHLADTVGEDLAFRKNSYHAPLMGTSRKGECFKFNPNTASLTDLQRLGFSEKQGEAIIKVREKKGFARKSDFAACYVVSEEMYQKLKPYIVLPKIDINLADTTELKRLPMVGSYYAKRIVERRNDLKGFSYPEQLIEIGKFGQERYDNIVDLITLTPLDSFPLWEADEDILARHPYIKWSAHRIIVYKKKHGKKKWTIDDLVEKNILPEYLGHKLKRCRIKEP